MIFQILYTSLIQYLQITVFETDFTLPYPVGAAYEVLQGNDNNGGHSQNFANGVFTKAFDFRLNIGDPVVAARDGIVVYRVDSFADSDHSFGSENILVISHDDVLSRYIHLSQGSILPEIGMHVKRGDTVALSGNSGFTLGIPHLHFDVIKDGPGVSIENQTVSVSFKNSTTFPGPLIQGRIYKALDYVPKKP